MLGEPQLLIGKPLINAQSDENRRWMSNLKELYAQSQLPSGLDQEAAPYRLDELQHLHRNGSVVWSEVTTTLVRSSTSGAMEFDCVIRDITARKQAESRLEWLAYYDELTELPNRTLVHNLLEQVIRAAHRDAKSVALLMLGLDHFKTINDSIGYDTGDALLIEVARRLKQELRSTDLIGCIGGDEFLVVFPGAEGTEAGQLGELLQKAMRRPFTVREQTINLTSSIGIAPYPLDGTDQEALVCKADTAMMRAKRDGFKDCGAQTRIAMKPGQRRVLPDTPEGRLLDLVESAKAHLRAKVEHPFRIIKCQFGFRKLYYRGIRKNDLKLKMLFAFDNLWMVRERRPCNA